MQIELVEQDSGLHGGREVWVRVLSNTVVDWPDVRAELTKGQWAALRSTHLRPSAYYPHMVTPKEKAEHGYSMEDWFVFRVRGSVAK